MTELELVRRIRKLAPSSHGKGLVLGIGDDCAIIRERGARQDFLYSTDLLIEGVHFQRDTHPARAVGWKALARGLSDIAAMGGDPRFCMVSIALPEWATARWIDTFYSGLHELAGKTGAVLVGGDLSRANQLVCDIVICGTAPRGKALRRDGARPGDGIFVSGTLGASSLGLRTGKGAAFRRHLYPEAKLRLGRHLRRKGSVTAAMDLSDGLSLDLSRLCEASGVAAFIDRPLPLFPGANMDDVLHGGEDYELLFTVRNGARVGRAFDGSPLTQIGVVGKGKPGSVRFFGWDLKPGGWDPFRERGGRV